MRNDNPQMLFINIKTIFVGLFFMIFFIVFIFNFIEFKNKFTSDLLYNTSVRIPTEFFLDFMSNEVALLGESDISITNNENLPSVSEIIATSLFDIKHKDITSLFGNEIPGFRSFNTEIAIAGKGTDLTNLPIESAPPLEVLLKEREIAAKELEESDNSSNQANNPPPQSTGEEAVFIYHSHSWEAFLPQLSGVTNPNEAVSFNESKNIIDVGRSLQEELIKKGIGSKHSTTNATEELKKKHWNYNQSYVLSREIVQEVLAQEQTIQYLIDIHRDSQPKNVTTMNINGKPYARLFFVVGKENGNYDKNLSLAKELNNKLEEKYPGISRGVFVKTKDDGNGVYNQDLSSKSMLLEFGGVENTKEELDNAIKAFAEVFSEYYLNAEQVNGDSELEEI
jgi:stage II sporulation protein P